MAGLRNHGAVQYHFGDRDALVSAIMDRRGNESEERRAEMVTDLMLDGNRLTVMDAVGAFVWPLALHLDPDNHYLAFLSRMITEEGGYEWVQNVHVGGSVGTLEALLQRLVPEIPNDSLTERWWLSLTSAVHALARYQSHWRKHPRTPQEARATITNLVAFLSGGISASLPENTSGQLRHPSSGPNND